MEKIKTLFIGLGNSLMQDDGIGLYITEKLRKDEFFDVFNCGPDAFRILNYLNEHKRVIIFDAIDVNILPGTVICLNEKGLFKFNDITRSIHQISALEALKIMKLIDHKFSKTTIFFVGIQIGEVLINKPLTEEVKKSADLIIKLLNETEIRDLLSNTI